jgi:mono/diheme cytochrome c family protein
MRNMQTRLLLLFVALGLAPFAWLPLSSAQIEIIPGSSDRGAELFLKRNCIECHSFRGVGGKVAPDLSQPNGRVYTPMQLAASLWNHGPRMWRAQDTRQLLRPTLDSMDTADLFAYFYSMSYFSAPGNSANGAMLFESKGCGTCHEPTASSAGHQRRKLLGPPISTWTHVDDPLIWAERMWNHSGKIHREFSQTGTAWPHFSTQEIVDLLAYLRSLPESRSQSAAFQPGDPEQGRITFEARCETCHSFGNRTAQPKVDLLKRPGPDVLMGYVAAMWNHAPVMQSRAGSEFPVLGPGDMRNLVAYLFAQRYFYEEGSVKKGAAVYEQKNCALCHEQRRKQTGAPDLTISTERYSPITMSAAIWRHGPTMLEKMRHENLAWPELNATEMADLITYLNTRLVPRLAR